MSVSGSSSQNDVEAWCLKKSHQQLRQLEWLVAQMKVRSQNHRLAEGGEDLWRSSGLVQCPCSRRVTCSLLLRTMSKCGPCPELGLGVPLSAHSDCRTGKERGGKGKGSARREPGGDNGEGSALVAVSRCPDGFSSSPPLPQEHFQATSREAARSLEEAQRAQGKRRPILTGSGRGVPALGPCTAAARAVAWVWRTFGPG